MPPQISLRSGYWSGIRESNPQKSDAKSLKTLHFLIVISIFVSILRKKSGHCVFRLDPVSVCNVRVNAYHGLIVRPSAELHHLQLRHAEVIPQRREAVPKPMRADLRQPIARTHAVDLVVNRVGVTAHDRPGLVLDGLQRGQQLRYHDRDRACGGSVFCWMPFAAAADPRR